MAEKNFPDLDKLSNILPLGLRPRGSKNSSLSLSGKFIFPAVTVIAIPETPFCTLDGQGCVFKSAILSANHSASQRSPTKLSYITHSCD